jgi:ATP-dependent RNA circularization protein (DNA/RNA ligase family)
MKKEELQDFVQNNPKLVTMRESTRYPGLFVLKYKKVVFFKNKWNDYLECCRGAVVDRDFNLVVHPFQKIYNHGVEDRAPVFKPDDVVMAYDKVNGFMVSVTTYKGELLVSTTGSLDSDFAIMAEQMILETADLEMVKLMCRGGTRTLMFECCHEDDPHIIPEQSGLYFLGYRDNTWDSTMQHMAYETVAMYDIVAAAHYMKVNPVPSYSVTTVADLEQQMKTSTREGVVFYHLDGRAAKIKTRHYLTQKLLARKRDITSLNMEIVDEEYYPLITAARAEGERFTNLDEQARLAWCRNYLETV